jgi:hypothetical protein
LFRSWYSSHYHDANQDAAYGIRERIYAGPSGCGILLYTGSPDSEGTLGGLVEIGRKIDQHLRNAIRTLAGSAPTIQSARSIRRNKLWKRDFCWAPHAMAAC